MDRTQKVNNNWESYSDDEDMDSVDSEELSQEQDATDPSQPRVPMIKRAMAEDKLQEKRLKERARRNGMASSIDEMRLLVPELIEAKKNYSQAKVVAFALAHIYELQRENDAFRERLGLPSRMDEFRARVKTNGKTKKERAPAGERGRKRRRLNNGAAATSSAPSAPSAPSSAAESAPPLVALPAAPSPSPSLLASAVYVPTAAPSPSFLANAAANAAEQRPLASSLSSTTSTPHSLASSGAEDDLELDLDAFVVDSLAASPALSPHAIDDELGPFASNFDNFDSHPRPHAMDWEAEGHDADMTDMFHHSHHHSSSADFISTSTSSSLSHFTPKASSLQFESFFVDHVLNHTTASLQ